MKQKYKYQQSKAFKALENLRKQYPRESKEQIFERWVKLLKSDESLKKALLNDAFEMMCDELYDEAVREGRPIHPALRKPS